MQEFPQNSFSCMYRFFIRYLITKGLVPKMVQKLNKFYSNTEARIGSACFQKWIYFQKFLFKNRRNTVQVTVLFLICNLIFEYCYFKSVKNKKDWHLPNEIVLTV